MQVPALTQVTVKVVGHTVLPTVHTLLAGLTVHTAVLVLRVKVTPPVLAALRLTAMALLTWLAYRLLGNEPMVKVAAKGKHRHSRTSRENQQTTDTDTQRQSHQ